MQSILSSVVVALLLFIYDVSLLASRFSSSDLCKNSFNVSYNVHCTRHKIES